MPASQLKKSIQRLRLSLQPQDAEQSADARLLADFVEKRDQAAFAALVHRHGPMVWGVCRRLLGQHHDAEDAFQAAFLVLARKASTVRPREMLPNWLHGVAYRTALKARTVAARRRMRERQVIDMPEPAATERDTWHEVEPNLDQELGRLPEKYRAAIILCDLEGKSRKEAARQFKIPEGTLSSRLSTARARLAQRLRLRGLLLVGASLGTFMSRSTAPAAVPVSLKCSTIKAAMAFAAGEAASAIPARVVALTQGVMKSMMLSKLKSVVSVVLVLGTIALGAGTVSRSSAKAQQKESRQPPTSQKGADAPTNGKGSGSTNEETKTTKEPPVEPVEDLPQTEWANKLFKERSKDFGDCKQGEVHRCRFEMTNIYAVPIDITSVRMSCGCATATLSRKTLQPKETGYLEVTLDTRRFRGKKSVVFYVTVGPNYVSTATVHVSANSRE